MQSSPPWTRRDWFWGLALVLGVIATYQPVWYCGFIWDDDLCLTANPCIVGPLGFMDIWTSSGADIAPLTISTFWLEHALWGLAPLPYHLVNVCLHAACAVLLWRLLRMLRVPGAWLGAALWALHPVEVESVAWIAELKNTESGLFFLLAIFFYLRWLTAVEPARRRAWNYALMFLFATLAMASKSSTVTLPLVLLLCAWRVEGKWNWRNLPGIAPTLIPAIAASLVSIWTQGLHLAIGHDPRWLRTWPERLAGAGDAVWFYLGKLLWPHPLIMVYPRWNIDAGDWRSYLPLAAVILVALILWLNRVPWSRAVFLVFAYFLVALLPALGLVDNPIFRASLVFDHFQYLASMGPLALAGAGLYQLAHVATFPKPWLPTALCAGLLLVMATVSWQRTWVYQNQETLWTDALAKNPDCWPGHNNLGNVFEERGQLDEAMAQYQEALALNPGDAETHNNLCFIFTKKGLLAQAISEGRKAVEIDPGSAGAHNTFGWALYQKGQLDEATTELKAALAINPGLATAHDNLAAILLRQGRIDEGIMECQKALAIDPNLADAHDSLGVALAQKGELADAIREFQNAVRLDPNNSLDRNNLARAQAVQQQAAGSP